MEVHYEITRRDVRAMNRHVQFGSYGGVVWRVLVVVSLLAVPLMVAVVVREYVVGNGLPWQMLVAMGFLVVAAAGLNEVFRRSSLGPHRLQVLPDAIVETKEGNEPRRFTWERITKVDRTARHVFVFVGIIQCIVVPTRAFA